MFSDLSIKVENLKTQIIELNNQKDEQDLLIGEKQDVIEELEKEIDEFTTNVEQNMIKICDHEDILNQQIQNINKQKITTLFTRKQNHTD